MKTIHLSENAHPLLLTWLTQQNCHLNLIHGNKNVEEPIRAHADIYMCSLAHDGSFVYHALHSPASPYPFDIGYNAVRIGKYFVHNLQHTAFDLMQKIDELNLIKVNVKQGYTKCNIAVLDEKHAITSDRGIFDALKSYAPDINLLLIEPKHVELPKFPYGFIGGASGKVGNFFVFHGNLCAHPNFNDICDFVKTAGLEIKYFPEFPLTDIGSVIEEETP